MQACTIYFRIDTRQDNETPSIIVDIVRSRHENFIIEGIVEGYWRGFPEETFAIAIIDDGLSVAETVEQIKPELKHDYIAVVKQGDFSLM